MRAHLVTGVFLVLAATFAAAQTPPQPKLEVFPPAAPRCIEQQPCKIEQLRVNNGQAPYEWRSLRGSLPPGLSFDRQTLTISGTPTRAGVFSAMFRISDSNVRQRSTDYSITITVVNTLEVEWGWGPPPGVRDATVKGELHVINHSGNDVSLTVVIVAVNEIGKAFTLGYQHFVLEAAKTSPSIPFGLQIQLPPGRYRVRADAVGEVEEKKIIYRSALEAGPFVTP